MVFGSAGDRRFGGLDGPDGTETPSNRLRGPTVGMGFWSVGAAGPQKYTIAHRHQNPRIKNSRGGERRARRHGEGGRKDLKFVFLIVCSVFKI